jgi:hypothetical protein
MACAALQQHTQVNAARRCNRSYAAVALHRILPTILLMVGDAHGLIAKTLRDQAANTQRFIPGRSRPRPADCIKPNPRCAYKE